MVFILRDRFVMLDNDAAFSGMPITLEPEDAGALTIVGEIRRAWKVGLKPCFSLIHDKSICFSLLVRK
jgi:hypothetical protein